MNIFLSRFAIKHAKLGLSRTLVLAVNDLVTDKRPIAAYYTLAASTICKTDITNTQSLPRYPVPVALLARLAVDVDYQGKGLGGKTLISAMRHAVRLCDEGLPVYGLILDVLDDDVLQFYQKYDFFYGFTDNPMRLFAPMSSLRKI